MKMFLVGILMMFGLAGLASAEDTVCINDPFCQGDKVVTYSTPSFFMIISSNGIQFGDGTTQTTAGGAGGGGVGALFTFTDNSGNKTAISSMTFPASIFNRLVTGSSITVLLNPSSVTMLGSGLEFYQTGSLVGSATSFVLGTNLSGSMSGRILTLSATGGSGGSDNFGTHTASKVIDAAGFAVTRVTSITFNSGTSPIIAGMVSSAAVNTISVAQHFNASSPGSGKVLSMNADNTLAWATDQTAAGGGDNMGNHVATMPVVSPFAITVASGTVYGQLSVGSITVNSAGAGVINSTHAVIKIKVTDLSDDDFEVAEDSVSVNGVRISTYQPNTSAVLANHSLDATANGNVISFRDQDRFTSPSFASGTFVTYIATPTMGISSSTIGHFQFNNAISSQANFAVYAWIPPSDIDLTANVILSSFGVILGGADTGTQRYIVAISTSMDGRPARETMFSSPYSWLEGITVDVAADAAGANGYLQVVGNTTLTNWQTRIIPGALHYITVMRDGDAAQDGSTVDSFSSFFSISYKRRLAQ